MIDFDDIEVCAECGDQFDYAERYHDVVDGVVCSIECFQAYYQARDRIEKEYNERIK